MSEPKSPAQVFVSYVREDRREVDRLQESLRTFGITLWIDRRSLRVGERWRKEIKAAIEHSRFFLACFSSNTRSVADSYMAEELRLAGRVIESKARVRSWLLPLRFSGRLPKFALTPRLSLADFQALDLLEGAWHEALWTLATTIYEAPGDADRRIAAARATWKSGDLALRRAALQDLFELRADPRTLPVFARALRENDAQLSSLASTALSSMGRRGVAELEKAAARRSIDGVGYMTLATYLARTDSLSANALRRFQRDMQSFKGARAKTAMEVVAARAGARPELVTEIRRALERGTLDPNDVAFALKGIKTSAVRELLYELRAIEELHTRLTAAAISTGRPRSRIPALQKEIEAHGLLALSVLLWRSYVEEIRAPLARIGAKHLDVLIARVREDAQGRGSDAAALLGEIGDPRALPALKEMSRDPLFGSDAREAIERMAERRKADAARADSSDQ